MKKRSEAADRELGRLRKKIGDQAEELKRLRVELEKTWEGSLQLQTAVTALLTAVTLEHGEELPDPEQGPGRRLEIPGFSAEELRRRYTHRARREKGGYVIEVRERQAPPTD